MKVDYAIYPSLLDAYLRYKRNEDEETFISLFDRINKVKQEEVPEHVIKGIEFERLIGEVINSNHTHQHEFLKKDSEIYKANEFEFNATVVNKISDKLLRRTSEQKYEEALFETPYGNVKLYGIIDYDYPEMIVDLKTVVSYSCGKYKDYAQHQCYALIREKNGNPIKAFKYLVTDFKKVYQETYIPSKIMFDKLMFTVYEFIAFINHFKKYITNKKIFGLED